jgi:hypothetical protein
MEQAGLPVTWSPQIARARSVGPQQAALEVPRTWIQAKQTSTSLLQPQVQVVSSTTLCNVENGVSNLRLPSVWNDYQ